MCVHVYNIFTPHIKGLNSGNVPNLWLGKIFTKYQLEFTYHQLWNAINVVVLFLDSQCIFGFNMIFLESNCVKLTSCTLVSATPFSTPQTS